MRRPGVLPSLWLLRLRGNCPDLDGSILIGTFAVQESGTAHPDAVNHVQEVGFSFSTLVTLSARCWEICRFVFGSPAASAYPATTNTTVGSLTLSSILVI